jgi:subtilisin family serine protease
MRALLVCILLTFTLLQVRAELAPFLQAKEKVENEYVILLKDEVTQEQYTQHLQHLRANFSKSLQNQLVDSWTIGPKYKAIHVKLTSDTLKWVRQLPEVALVEENGVVHASDCVVQQNAEWNLARINERDISLVDSTYSYDAAGEGVDSYIIDTGVLTTHQEFGTRATWGTNTIDATNQDCNGHGTHVAGTVAGTLYGVAKKTTIIAVKCLNCAGGGTITSVIAAMSWVANDHTNKGNKRPSVANMSLGGGGSPALNQGADALVAAGVTLVVAAGNSNANACLFSPAGASRVISVGATTIVEEVNGAEKDRRTSFSNYGSCVHLLAPGQLIKAAWKDVPGQPPNNVYNTISGTSMAAPHVAGVAALLLSQDNTLTPEEVKAKLVSTATHGVVDLACGSIVECAKTANSLVYTNC